MLFSLVILGFPKNSSLNRVSALQLFQLKIQLLNWSPFDLVVECGGHEAFCSLMIKLWHFSGPSCLWCIFQEYLTLLPHTLGVTERLEGMGLGKFSFNNSAKALVLGIFSLLRRIFFFLMDNALCNFRIVTFPIILPETWGFLGDLHWEPDGILGCKLVEMWVLLRLWVLNLRIYYMPPLTVYSITVQKFMIVFGSGIFCS